MQGFSNMGGWGWGWVVWGQEAKTKKNGHNTGPGEGKGGLTA